MLLAESIQDIDMDGELLFEYLLFACGLAAAAAYSFWFGFKAWRENRLVGDTPTSRVRSAAQGYVGLSGKAAMLPKTQSVGPLTGIPCAWWQYTIEDRQGSRWEPRIVDRGVSESTFILDDGSGQCVIDPRGAEVFSREKTVWYGDSEWPLARIPRGQGFFGGLTDALIPNGRYRYTEHRLQPNECLYTLGAFGVAGGVRADDPDAAVAALLHDWKQDQKSLLARFDDNHDGVLSSEEWGRARAAARQQILDHASAQPQTPSISVLSQPMDGRVFLLAALDGRSLSRRLRWRAATAIAAFVSFSVAFVYALAVL
jgi:hypothetical protein